MSTLRRFDSIGRLDAKARTPQGGLRVDANLTRTGIFTYRDASGKEVREYRPAEEVFKADSLESFKMAPVVIGHPSMVNADNWRAHSVGTIGENVRADGPFVVAQAVIQDRKTIDAIERGDLVEVSCGYSVDLDPTPGVTPDGEKYDAVQRNIRGNHVGLGPLGWGRAGGSVRLRLDGDGHVVLPDVPIVDGMTLEEMTKRAEKAEADLRTATARADKAEGERDAERARADKADADAKQARADAAAIDIPKLTAARTALESSARKVLGADAALTVKEDGKDARPMTDHELKVAVCSKQDPKFRLDGKGPGYLDAFFDLTVSSIETSREDSAHREVANAIIGAAETGNVTESRYDAAIRARDEANAAAGKGGVPKGAMTRAGIQG